MSSGVHNNGGVNQVHFQTQQEGTTGTTSSAQTPPSSKVQKKEVESKPSRSAGEVIKSGLKKALAVLGIPLGVIGAIVGVPLFLVAAGPALIIGGLAGAMSKKDDTGYLAGLNTFSGMGKGVYIASAPIWGSGVLIGNCIDALKK